MPILATLLVTFFSQFFGFFGLYFGRKVAMALAAVAAVGTLFVAIIACMRQTVIGLLGLLTASGPFAMGLGIAFPIHSALCLSSIATTWACTVLFKWQKTSLDMAVKA